MYFTCPCLNGSPSGLHQAADDCPEENQACRFDLEQWPDWSLLSGEGRAAEGAPITCFDLHATMLDYRGDLKEKVILTSCGFAGQQQRSNSSRHANRHCRHQQQALLCTSMPQQLIPPTLSCKLTSSNHPRVASSQQAYHQKQQHWGPQQCDRHYGRQQRCRRSTIETQQRRQQRQLGMARPAERTGLARTAGTACQLIQKGFVQRPLSVAVLQMQGRRQP